MRLASRIRKPARQVWPDARPGLRPLGEGRIIPGTCVLSSGYSDTYSLRAQKVRTLLRRDFTTAFEKVGTIICHTTPEPAFKAGARSDDPLKCISPTFSPSRATSPTPAA